MPKHKTRVIQPRIFRDLAFCLVSLAFAIVGTVVLILDVIPPDFKIGIIGLAILGALGGLFFGSRVILPSRLVLTENCLLLQSITGNVRMQIPYANIAQVRFHSYGEGDQEIDVAGIDLVKRKAKDTWWPRSLKGKTYDVELGEDWVKPPNVIVRMIQNEMERIVSDVGRKK